MTTPDLDPRPSPLGPRGHGQELRLDPSHPRLARARDGRVLTGLCAGIAEFVGSPPTAVRTVFVAGAVLTLGTLALAYLALSALVPAAASKD
ncbi:MAG TPA: PspC domain-containing protein [Trueperaceae bacterium]|nr:PspC domain-containing protein [Trueperaceae bacterium]